MRLAKEYNLKHRFGVHSAGDCNHKAKVASYSEIQVNTGLVDQMWAESSGGYPSQSNKEEVNGLGFHVKISINGMLEMTRCLK